MRFGSAKVQCLPTGLPLGVNCSKNDREMSLFDAARGGK